MMSQFIVMREKFKLIRRESAALVRIVEQVNHAGLNYGAIREFMCFDTCRHILRVDLYGWRLEVSGLDVGHDWDVDKWEAEMLRLPFKNKAEFKRVYRLARMVTRIS
ncbi:hypothetical protein [Providencia rettgeri]|uniref:hypothetical protein n=1 Tax=Providencia rettgeri TaxID=587 RepID=UPI0030172FC4